MPPDVVLRPEQASDKTAVDALYAVAFGPGRFARTAWRLRQDLAHDPAVSFVADRRNLVIGAIRQTPVTVGGAPAYLLGPLAVAETAAKQGIGRALLDRSIASARASEAHAIVLVGDLAFYGPSGFERTGEAIEFPGPVERHRLLALPLRRRVRGALRPEGPHRPAHAPQAPADPAVRKGDPIQGG